MPPNSIIQITDDDEDNQEYSQMKKAAQPAKTPSRRRGGDKRPNYKECGNGDSGSASDTEEANDEYMGFKGDIPAKKPSAAKKVASRAQRPQDAKQEPMSSEQQTPDRRVIIKPVKRSHGDDESEPVKPAKRGRKPTASTEIKRFEKDALALAERFGSKMIEYETTRSENQNLQAQIKTLKSELEQAQQAHKQSEASFNQKIDQLKNDSQKWRCDLASALEAAKKNSGKYVKVSDSEVAQNWMTLSYNIRGLVSQCLTQIPADQDTILESLVMEHRLLSIDDMSTLRSCILRRAGKIGNTLTQSLLIKNYHHRNDPKYLQIISQIKSRVVADLSDEGHLNKEAMEALINKAKKRLGPFIPKPKVNQFRNEIRRLITDTADLHLMRMKSKAIFLLYWCGDDDGKRLHPYDQNQMKSIQYDKDTDISNFSVKFVEAPALMKIGTADGEKFDTSMILCKSEVALTEDDNEDSEDGDDFEEDDDESSEDSDEDDDEDERGGQ
ncbi:uncharacterized protein Triagg1_3053 [Trichoderma aggressivum f. europaeum]|uniref:Uncharacterized protein n=1 Tax=Trichoderma aggressivum f. europaeum TaxID=173218 RepID=A0AAE1M102_9HYPO|nr:hypothetical protein Triagg1_3053 [Trichoderma aggressivum f. europaeum]